MSKRFVDVTVVYYRLTAYSMGAAALVFACISLVATLPSVVAALAMWLAAMKVADKVFAYLALRYLGGEPTVVMMRKPGFSNLGLSPTAIVRVDAPPQERLAYWFRDTSGSEDLNMAPHWVTPIITGGNSTRPFSYITSDELAERVKVHIAHGDLLRDSGLIYISYSRQKFARKDVYVVETPWGKTQDELLLTWLARFIAGPIGALYRGISLVIGIRKLAASHPAER